MPKRTQSPRPPYLQAVSPASSPFDPSTFRPDFDLTHECVRHYEDYKGDCPLSLVNFPSYLHTDLERVRNVMPSYPAFHIVACAAVAGGLRMLRDQQVVQDLVELNKAIHKATAQDPDDLEEVALWFRSFFTSAPNFSGDARGRHNITLSAAVKRRLEELSGRLGMTYSALAQFSIITTLSGHDECIHRGKHEKSVRLFLKRANRRVQVGKVLLSTV